MPHEVLADPRLRARFTEVCGARDGATRTPREGAHPPALTLRSVAWLWPDRINDPSSDPFDGLTAPSGRDAEEWRARLAAELRHLLVFAQIVVGRDTTALLDYLMWELRMSRRELVRVIDGYYHLEWIEPVLSALNVDYLGGWVLRDPEHLTRRIDQALLARSIGEDLRHLTIKNLTNLVKHNKIPSGRAEPEPAEPEPRNRSVVYRAPAPGSPYRALYEVLALDDRDHLDITPAELSLRIAELGGEPLPAEAMHDPSWWEGSSVGRVVPEQVSAWQAAGYRLANTAGLLTYTYRPRRAVLPDGEVVTVKAWPGESVLEPECNPEPEITEVVGVRLVAMPGRNEWLADAGRVERGEYRLPSRIPVPPRASGEAALEIETDVEAAPREPQLLRETKPAVSTLAARLAEIGEADANQLRDLLPNLDRSEFEKVLSSARRATTPVVKNHGSKTRPRWVAVGSTADYILPIARALWFDGPADQVPRVNGGPAVPDWFARRVEEEVHSGFPFLAEGDDPIEATALRTALLALAERQKQTPNLTGVDAELRALAEAVDDLVKVRLLERDHVDRRDPGKDDLETYGIPEG